MCDCWQESELNSQVEIAGEHRAPMSKGVLMACTFLFKIGNWIHPTNRHTGNKSDGEQSCSWLQQIPNLKRMANTVMFQQCAISMSSTASASTCARLAREQGEKLCRLLEHHHNLAQLETT